MRVYLDHNATTPMRAEARARWLEVLDSLGGNASSLHAGGRAARAVIDDARERTAQALGVHEEEVIFTSGGTESNNLALAGALECAPGALVTTAAEHSSVLDAAHALAARGHALRLIAVDRNGAPELDAAIEALSEPCALVSIMAANNEVGSVPDLGELRAVIDSAPKTGSSGTRRPLFHTDAVQALGRLPVDLEGWGVDLASFSAHKLGGPVGVGVLWRKRGVALTPLLFGGGQEHELRAGTEDAAGIAAAAVAFELAVREQTKFAEHTRTLTAALWSEIRHAISGARLVGPPLNARRLPNTLCLCVPNTDGKVVVTQLDLEGVEASAGSACASGSVEPSHVLRAMGYDDHDARAGLRLSLGKNTTVDECKHAVRVLTKLFAPSHAT